MYQSIRDILHNFAAAAALIGGQNFFMEPKRASSVGEWVNYWAGRDFISSPLSIADRNVKVDAGAEFAEAEERARELLFVYQLGPEFDKAKADHAKLSSPGSTGVWHSLYFDGGKLDLPSLGRTLDTGMGGTIVGELSNI
jgi:hypothetical protein